jgi:anaerobic magnesium-protoporphyrin IX monomethyl ester cyclase
MENSLIFPKYLSIQTTSYCNANCIFCPNQEVKHLFPPKVMDEVLYKKIIDECKTHRELERIILYLNNEPLTDIHIVDRINYAKEIVPWASVHILTNGSLLNDKMQDDLINSKLDWIGLSIHGIKKQSIQGAMGLDYDTLFPQLLKFIQKAKCKRNLEEFIMVTFLNHKYLSAGEKDQAINFWKDQGISRISYFESPISRAGNVSSLPQIQHSEIFGCASIWANEMMHIVENGEVVLCCMDWRREVVLGNLNDQNIYEVWNSQKYAKVRSKRDGDKKSKADFICKKCEAAIVSKESKPLPVILDKNSPLDILLVICPMWGLNMPPLGVSYLHAYLKQAGYHSSVLDININLFYKAANEHKDLWRMQNFRMWNDRHLFQEKLLPIFDQEINFYVNEIFAQNVAVVGFSVNAGNLLFSIELARRIKERDQTKIIIFGGPHSKWFKTDINYLEQGHLEQYKDWYWGFYSGLVDIFVIGEGEVALLEILRRFKNKIELGQIPGTILYKHKYLCFEGENLAKDLNTLAFPDFSWTDLDKYTEKKIPILLSRGCIRKCAFCNDAFVSAKYRCRSAENIFAEIKLRLVNNKISNFEFLDLLINGNLRELEKLCDLIIKEKIKINWSGQGVIRDDMSLTLLSKMKKAGCSTITYGTESFSDKVLQLMKKPYTYEDIKKVLSNTTEAGIRVAINIVTGFPGEGEEEFRETIKRLEECSRNIGGISSLAPCLINLGSALHANPKEYGIIYSEKDYYFNWYTADGNNYKLRKARAKEILSLALRLKLPVGIINLYDEQADEQDNQKEIPLLDSGPLDILLVTLPPWGVENPPIGLGYLDSYIKSKGLKSAVQDFNIYFHNCAANDYKMLWHVENKNYWSNEKTFPAVYKLFENQIEYAVSKISSSQANLIGFSVVDPKERITTEVIRRVKKAAPEKKIILGGPACSTQEQRDLFANNLPGVIDYFVVGEGEETLYEIIQKKQKAPDDDLSGLAYKVDGVWRTINRKPIIPLDAIPFPDYRGFDLSQYLAGHTMLVEWSRGCLGHCSFCKNYRLVQGYRRRSPEHILKELVFLKDNYSVDNFTVCDNLMNGDVRQLRGICEGMIKQGIQMRWSGQIAPRRQMQGQLFNRMRQAGCFKVQIGVESGSKKVLALMKKPYLPQTAAENIKAAKRSGMETEIFLLIGFPGETEKEFLKTIDFIKRNSRYIDTIKSINTLHLIAGTEIYDHPERFNLVALPKDNWHYLWETKDGNTYAVRKRRVEELLGLASLFGIKVQETNIKEGKEVSLSAAQGLSEGEKTAFLKNSIISLQELPMRRQVFKEQKRNVGRWLLLIFSAYVIFIYIIYFWFLMFLSNQLILGGRKE